MLYENAKKDLIEVLDSFMNLLPVKNKRMEIIMSLQYRVDMDVMTSLFNKNMPFNLLPDKTLYYILVGFKKWHIVHGKKIAINEALLNPEKYFTSVEIVDYNAIPTREENIIKDTFVFHGVQQVTPQMWTVSCITAQEIQALFDSTLLRYEFSMQRESEKKKSKFTNEYYERIKIYDASVKEMEAKMLRGEYIPTPISINILKAEKTPIHYEFDEDEATFTLSKLDRNSLIDGMHRCNALINALIQNPELNQKMQLNIFTFTLSQARDFIYQEGQKNPIPKGILRTYNSSDPYVKFVNEFVNLGTNSDNLLKDKVGVEKDDVLKVGKLTTVEKLATALEDNFNINMNSFQEKRNTSQYLIDFFNELFLIYGKDIEDPLAQKSTKVHLHENMFFAYMRIASKLQNKPQWDRKLKNIIQAIDFKKENWEKLGMKSFDFKKDEKSKLYKYIDAILEAECL